MNQTDIASELLAVAKELAASEKVAGRAIELVEKKGSPFENEPRYMIMFQGKPWGELYFNMRGYVAEHGIPVPSSLGDGTGHLDIGERSLSVFKSEISKANREWAGKPMMASEKVAMPMGMDSQVHALLEAAKKSGSIIDRLTKSFIPMGRVLRDSNLDRPTSAAISAMEEARDALGKLIGICNSELVEHETAFMSSEKE